MKQALIEVFPYMSLQCYIMSPAGMLYVQERLEGDKVDDVFDCWEGARHKYQRQAKISKTMNTHH